MSSAQNSTSFSADARTSLFQALGLKAAAKPIEVGQSSTRSLLTPYGNQTTETSVVHRQAQVDRNPRKKAGKNRSSEDDTPPPEESREEKRNGGNGTRQNKNSAKPIGRVVILTEPEPEPQPEVPPVVSTSRAARLGANNSQRFAAPVASDVAKSSRPTPSVQILKRPDGRRNSNSQQVGTEHSTASISPRGPSAAPTVTPAAATPAAEPKPQAPNKPVPMLIQILTAAKAKSEQRRAEKLSAEAPAIPAQVVVPAPVPALASAPASTQQAVNGRSRQRNASARGAVDVEPAPQQQQPSRPQQQRGGGRRGAAISSLAVAGSPAAAAAVAEQTAAAVVEAPAAAKERGPPRQKQEQPSRPQHEQPQAHQTDRERKPRESRDSREVNRSARGKSILTPAASSSSCSHDSSDLAISAASPPPPPTSSAPEPVPAPSAPPTPPAPPAQLSVPATAATPTAPTPAPAEEVADAAAADAFIYIRCAAEGGIGEDNVAANVRADARAGGADLLEQGYLSEGSDDLLLMEATRSSDLLPGADDDEEEENHFGDLIPEGGSTYSRTGSAGSLFAANNILGGVTAAAVAGVGVRSAGSSPALMLTSNVLSAASLIDDRHFLALDAPPPQPQPQGAHTPQLSQVNSERISRPVTPASVYSHSAHSTPSRRSPFAMTAGAAAPAPTPPTFPTTFTPSTFTTTASSRCSPSAASAAAAEPPVTPAPQQAALPVDEHRDKILQHVRAHPVTIINGMTGCGKSTRIPVMILEDSRHHRHHKHHHHHHHSSSSAVAPSNGSASTGADDTSSSGACGDVSSAGGGDAFVMVSQPRRIAASALKNRLAQTLGDTVGLRLGHGKREESPNTRIWFVTTGYLVRLLAHKMHTFARYSHLVIDEIHERSLDCDLLCYLAKRLLHAFPHIKIVLMSATAHSAMFQSYFDTPHDPIFVGVRRFPLKEYFGEDLYSFLPSAAQKTLSRLLESTSRCNQRLIEEVVPDNIVKDQLAVAAVLARAIAKPGGAVLIFVSGMSDITELMEIMSSNLQNQKRNDSVKTQILAVHSDIPHEQQLLAFQPTQPDEIKIVIATNAAESSVTIPDVDHVICLGTSKLLTYSARHHTTQLVNSWISKASATQRAGRTGRVRPGSVYHLYCCHLYGYMHDYEVSEVHRQPMTEIALRLKSMLASINTANAARAPSSAAADTSKEPPPPQEQSAAAGGDDSDDEELSSTRTQSSAVPLLPGVTAVLRALIEPPSLQSIEDALYTLYECGMLTSPYDGAHLTEIGSLAADLPLDFMLGRFIGYAVLLGVSREAVIIAAALGNPRSPFRTPSQLLQTDPDEYNSHCRQLFLSMARLDRGLLSEPLMLVQAFIEWQQLSTEQERVAWCRENCIVPTRMRQLNSVLNNLYATVYSSLTQTKKKTPSQGQARTVGAGKRDGDQDARLNANKNASSNRNQQSALDEDDHAYSESLASLHALTPRAVNALRLCMLWAFPHHVLKQKSVFASEEQMCTADLPQLSVNSAALNNFLQGRFSSSSSSTAGVVSNREREFSGQRGEELSVDWRLVAQGKRTYVADVLDRSFEGMLDAFLNLLGDLEAHVAWLSGSYTKPESVLIVYDRAVAEEKLRPYLVAIFGKDLIRMNSTTERVILKAVVTHRSQLTKLNDVFQEDRWKMFAWEIPGSGPASLICANCVPSEKQIRHLFLGRDLATRIASADLTDAEFAQRWHLWDYKSKIARSKLKVVFPDDYPTAYCNGGYMTAEVGGAPVRLYRYEVIRDIPLGLRLINFVRLNSNTDRHLRLTVPPAAPGDVGEDDGFGSGNSSGGGGGSGSGLDSFEQPHTHSGRPHSQPSFSQDARNSSKGGGGGGSSAVAHKSSLSHNHNPNQALHSRSFHSAADALPHATTNIKINSVVTEWVKLPSAGSDQSQSLLQLLQDGGNAEYDGGLGGAQGGGGSGRDEEEGPGGAPRRVTFAPYSLQRVSQHLGNEAVYCVAYSLMLLTQPSGDRVFRAEGATVLPVGSQWLSLALACVSRLDTNVTRNFKDGCQLSPHQCSVVERISDFLSQCSIRYCFQRPFNPLNRDLDDLFAAWVSNSSGGGGGSGASGLGGGSLDGELFNLEEEMESFMPLLLSHSSANAGRGAADNSSNSNYGGQGHQHNYQYRPGHSSSKSSADEPQPASATAASPACGNAWLSHSAAVRAAGPLAQRQHQSQPSQQAQQAQGLHGAQSGDSFEECL